MYKIGFLCLFSTTLSAADLHWTRESRQEALSRAQVMEDTDLNRISRRDVRIGPTEETGKFLFRETLRCDWLPKPGESTGFSPKIYCQIPGEKKPLKIKVDDPRTELYSEVAASRLFWALGFPADRNYPVRVDCRNCPKNFDWQRGRKTRRLLDPATAERKFPGTTIETRENEGWHFRELRQIRSDGATLAQIDALKLLAVFVGHADNKPSNQRIVCPENDVHTDAHGVSHCEKPLLIIHDLGATFGSSWLGGLRQWYMDSKKWANEPIWRDRATCHANLNKYIDASFKNPIISEKGRRYLADRLERLTDRQIHDLFVTAQVELKEPGSLPKWIAAFKEKRSEILETRCAR